MNVPETLRAAQLHLTSNLCSGKGSEYARSDVGSESLFATLVSVG